MSIRLFKNGFYKIAPIFFALLFFANVQTKAADGDLDAVFGTGGKFLTSSATSDYLERIALQPDGKIIAAGYSSPVRTNFNFSCFAVRYNADGSIDSGFGSLHLQILRRTRFRQLLSARTAIN